MTPGLKFQLMPKKRGFYIYTTLQRPAWKSSSYYSGNAEITKAIKMSVPPPKFELDKWLIQSRNV
jgi:hypothetical protein